MGEASIQKFIPVSDPSCYQTHWRAARVLEDAHGQLAHQRLTVGRTLACDDKIGIPDHLLIVDGFEQEIDAGTARCVQIL